MLPSLIVAEKQNIPSIIWSMFGTVGSRVLMRLTRHFFTLQKEKNEIEGAYSTLSALLNHITVLTIYPDSNYAFYLHLDSYIKKSPVKKCIFCEQITKSPRYIKHNNNYIEYSNHITIDSYETQITYQCPLYYINKYPDNVFQISFENTYIGIVTLTPNQYVANVKELGCSLNMFNLFPLDPDMQYDQELMKRFISKVMDTPIIPTFYKNDNNVKMYVGYTFDKCEKQDNINKTEKSKKKVEWKEKPLKLSKKMKHLILDEGVKARIEKNIEAFRRLETIAKTYSVPYKRSILLYGIPGTGKTATASAISDVLNMPIYYIEQANLETVDLLPELLENIPSNSVVVFDDVDILLSSIGRNQYTSVFSKLLHILDGYSDLHGCFLIFTTNKEPSDIDPALIRPGRIDDQIEYSHLTTYQFKEFLRMIDENNYAIYEKKIDVFESEQKYLQPIVASDFLMNYILPYCHDMPILIQKVEMLFSKNKFVCLKGKK